MMEGVQMILGRDWLDMVNPLIDWKTNSMVLKCGDKLEVITGVSSKATCCIKDHGLSGLQRIFNSQDGNSSNFPNDHN